MDAALRFGFDVFVNVDFFSFRFCPNFIAIFRSFGSEPRHLIYILLNLWEALVLGHWYVVYGPGRDRCRDSTPTLEILAQLMMIAITYVINDGNISLITIRMWALWIFLRFSNAIIFQHDFFRVIFTFIIQQFALMRIWLIKLSEVAAHSHDVECQPLWR